MDYVGDTLFSQPLMPTELQDLLMCESYFDDYTNSNLMDHDNTTHITTASSNNDNTDSRNNNNISSLAQRLDATTATQAQQIAQLQAQLQALTSGIINFNNWEFDNPVKSGDIDSSIYETPELLANVSSPDSQPSIISTFTSPSESSLSSPSPLDSLLPDFNMASSPPHGYPSMPSLKEELDQDHDELRRNATIVSTVTNVEQQLAFMQQQLSPLSKPDNPNQNFKDKSTVASKKRRTTSTNDMVSPRKIASVPSRSSKRGSKSDEMSMLRGETHGGQITSAAAINIPVQFPSVNLAAPAFNFSQPVFPHLISSDLGNKIPIQRLKPPVGTPVQHPPPGKQVKQKKVAHNAIERRYRNNINDRIADLKNVVPALYHAKLKDPKDKGNKRPAKDDDEEDEGDDSAEIYDGVAAATKLNKATILRKATEYILYLKKNNERCKEENAMLRALLAQFPGGLQLLEGYQLQESARELQQLKKESSPSLNDSDEDVAIADSNNNPGNRVMMVLFMAVSFMGTNPVTSWNSGSSHHHEGKALGGVAPGTNASDEPDFTMIDGIGGRLNSIFGGIQVWTLIRIMILVFLAYFCLPSIWFRRRRRAGKVGQGESYKKQSKAGTKATSNDPYTIYRDLVASLPNPLPHGKYSLRLGIFIEALQFAFRHMLGFDYWSHSSTNAVDEEKLARTWIRLGEIECLGGNPRPSRESLLYTCLKTLNAAELLENESILASSQIYANAAIQVALALPNYPTIAAGLSRYFWGLAMHSAKTNSDDESAEWIESFLLDVHEDDHEEHVSRIIDSKVWNDALDVIKKRFAGISECRGRKSRKGAGAYSKVPIEILCDFQSLHNLYTVFQHLITLITSSIPSSLTDDTSYSKPTFDSILENTTHGTVAYWYAICGAAVESFWKNDVKKAENRVLQLKDLPKFPAVDRNDEKAWDSATKQMIAYTLIGVAFVKHGKIVEGTRVLEKSRKIGEERKRIAGSQEDRGLESNVRVLAEFVAGICGLEAWINIWRIVASKGSHIVAPVPMLVAGLKIDEEKDILVFVEEQQLTSETGSIPDIDLPIIYKTISMEIISLRHKMKIEPLNKLDDMEYLLDRLCVLGKMIYEIEQFDINPIYDSVSDEEERTKQAAVNAGEEALRILKGYKLLA